MRILLISLATTLALGALSASAEDTRHLFPWDEKRLNASYDFSVEVPARLPMSIELSGGTKYNLDCCVLKDVVGAVPCEKKKAADAFCQMIGAERSLDNATSDVAAANRFILRAHNAVTFELKPGYHGTCAFTMIECAYRFPSKD